MDDDLRTHPDLADALAPAPRATADLIGHAAAENRFLEAARAGRLAGAWLITGAEGIGKATLAFRLARFLLAGGAGQDLFGAPGDLAVDEADPVFHRVAAGAHGDLLTVERTPNPKTGKMRSEIVVEDVRRMQPFFHQSAGEGGWRVAIVDGAEQMNRNAANAALKLIEEPPKQSVVLLVSHAPARLLPTIRSRCRTVPLKGLKTEQVELLLERYRPDLDQADHRPLATLADGSPGRALRLAELGGLDLYRDLIGLMAKLPALAPAEVHGLADRLARASNDMAFRTTLDLLRWWLARLVREGAGGQAPEPVVAEERELIARLTARPGLERWLDVWEKVGRLQERAISVNLDRKQVVLSSFDAMENAARA
jgi:DNA polymerase-3 subunit delta'